MKRFLSLAFALMSSTSICIAKDTDVTEHYDSIALQATFSRNTLEKTTMRMQHDDAVETITKFWGIPQFLESFLLNSIVKNFITAQYPVSYPEVPTSVQTSTSLCQAENLFTNNRMDKVQKILSQEFGIEQPLRIAFCCGGGGNRAMVGAHGLLTAAAKSKILDASLYAAGVSGSTWVIAQLACLVAKGYQEKDLEKILMAIKQDYYTSLSTGLMLGLNDIYMPALLPLSLDDNFILENAKRFAYDQPITLVNLFGPLVGNYALNLVGDERIDITWSSIAQELQKGDMPLPLCAAIFERDAKYEWFEMSPFQVGSSSLGYIPVEYLGSKFKQGNLQPDGLCPEYPISFFLGMYGSAFAATVKEIIAMKNRSLHGFWTRKNHHMHLDDMFATEGHQSLPLSVIEQKLWEQLKMTTPEAMILGEPRFFGVGLLRGIIENLINDLLDERLPSSCATFSNFAQDMIGMALHDKSELGLFDAGIDCNLPVATLLDRPERNVDIVIMYDSHAGDAQSLRKAYEYAKRKNLPFPDMSNVTQKSLTASSMSVFNDPRSNSYDKNIPTCIYFPTLGIDSTTPPYITLNFKYEPEDIDILSDSMQQVFLEKVAEIKTIMKLVANARWN